MKGETGMKIRISEEYYKWSCEWCDSENRVPWAMAIEELRCGACHRKEFAAPSATFAEGVRIFSPLKIASGMNQ